MTGIGQKCIDLIFVRNSVMRTLSDFVTIHIHLTPSNGAYEHVFALDFFLYLKQTHTPYVTLQ